MITRRSSSDCWGSIHQSCAEAAEMDVWWTCLFFVFLTDDVFGLSSKFQCPKIQLKNGKARSRNRGKFVRFACNTGYLLAGDKYAICVEDSATGKYRWDDSSMPRCVRPTCKNVTPPMNGLIYPSHSGAVLNYFCKPNFHMSGSSVVYCNGTHWDNPAPACLPAGSKPPLSCDFEEEHICGWTHDLNHDFDWRRLRFKTPSWQIGTGPSYDHTKGEGQDGYYMYIESTQRNENDTARLISPVFDKTVDGDTCLEFYYHMYGSTTGDLRVYMRKIGESVWSFDPNRAVFWKSGNQGNRWYRGFVQLGKIDDQFQIIVEGVRKGYISDIAIDDVKIIQNCVVDDEIDTTTEISSSSASTTDVYTIESCENRCDSNETLVNFDITCDCDSNCWERNRCCPDYFDFCFAASSDDTTITDTSTTMIEEETTELSAAITVATTILAVVKKQTIAKPKLPPILIVTKPTAIVIYEKTIKPPPPVVVQKLRPPVIKDEKSKPTLPTRPPPKITYVKPPYDERNDLSNDIVDVPPTPTEQPEDPDVFLQSPMVKARVKDVAMVANNKSSKAGGQTTVFIVGIVLGILFGMLVVVFVTKRLAGPSCSLATRTGIGRMRRGNFGSQSEVRFLTGNDVLNLDLAY